MSQPNDKSTQAKPTEKAKLQSETKQSPKFDQPPEEALPAKKLEKIRMRTDFSFQVSMPARPDIFVTINLKKDQLIADKDIIKHVTSSPSAPFAYEE